MSQANDLGVPVYPRRCGLFSIALHTFQLFFVVTGAILLASLAACGEGELSDDFDDTDDPAADVRETMALGCPGARVQVFEHANFAGRSLVFCQGKYPDLRKHQGGLSRWERWNDRISSIRMFGASPSQQVVLTIFADINYAGDHGSTFCGNGWPCKKDISSRFNDRISSMVIYLHTY